MASASVKIISDTVAKWREAGHPLRNHSTLTQFEVTPFPSEDGTGPEGVPDQPTVPGTNPSPDPKEEPLKQAGGP